MSGVAVASGSQLAADAGAAVARAGGNAVDVAIASVLTSMTTEPGVCSLGASGFVTVGPGGGEPVTIEGYAAMPGLGLPREALGQNAWEIEMGYGGGMKTIIGFGSVAVPGAVAALGHASRRYGRLPWREVVMPAVEIHRAGFPMPRSCHHYMEFAADPIYGWEPESRPIFRGDDGRIVDVGVIVRIPGLADTLTIIAEEGPESFYTGDLGHRLADYVTENGGALTRRDLAEYSVSERTSLSIDLDDWRISTSPAPAVGGAALAAMLMLMREASHGGWTADMVARGVEIQRRVIGYRKRILDRSDDLDAAIGELMREARDLHLPVSAETVHTSAVDGDGSGCSITMSAGYGAGVLPPGTGCWLNNSLGEVELNPDGLKIVEPGTRLSSNMAPTVARRSDGKVMAIGSPGADRITTAIFQVLVNYIHFGMPLADAVAHARAHVEQVDDGFRVAIEPGLPRERITLPQRQFDSPSMYFGGAAAASWSPESGFEVAGDPRRQGGTAIVATD
jgi:gamma-glutamyltranspeptidase/glutathione hydrolase